MRVSGEAERSANPIDPPSRPTPMIVNCRGNITRMLATRFDLHHAEFVQVQRHDLPIALFDGQPIEPELVVLAMSVPAARLLLLERNYRPGPLAVPGVIPSRNLLNNLHSRARNQLLSDRIVHGLRVRPW